MAKSPVAELEAQLRAAWSWDDLAVWADALIEAGDPRGERIATDVAPTVGEAWRGRRRAMLAAWLGADRAAECAPFVQHGFVHEARFGAYPAGMLGSALGEVVRGFSVVGGAERVAGALRELADAPRPWLSRLAITYTGDAVLPDSLAERLVAATPALRELVLFGRPVFAQLAHPELRVARFEPRAEIRVIAATEGRVIAALAHADRDLLLELIDATPDCNQLYTTHAELFDEPLPALVAQLEAAGLIVLDGPIARLATTDRAPVRGIPAPPRPIAWEHELVAYVELGGQLPLGPRTHHAQLVASARDSFPLGGANQRALDRYLETVARVGVAPYWEFAKVPNAPGLRRALNALVELRALWPDVLADAAGWGAIEVLATMLAHAPSHAGLELGRR